MRLEIRHLTNYNYEAHVRFSAQYLRLTPYNNRSQRLVRWRIAVPGSSSLHEWRDGFGNICQTVVNHEPVDRISIEAKGVVETTDVSGVLPQEEDSLPLGVFLHHTPLTKAENGIVEFAERHRAGVEKNRVEGLHALMDAIHEAVEYRVDETHVHTRAAEALADGFGVCQDHAHIFIACARFLGIPARYVSGYLFDVEAATPHAASHAWAGAWVPDLGWVSFDVANRICATDRHVGMAVALDYAGAPPVRGVRHGGEEDEGMHVEVHVRQTVQ